MNQTVNATFLVARTAETLEDRPQPGLLPFRRLLRWVYCFVPEGPRLKRFKTTPAIKFGEGKKTWSDEQSSGLGIISRKMQQEALAVSQLCFKSIGIEAPSVAHEYISRNLPT